MLIARRCAYARADGQPCRMAPLHDRPYCFSHDPERAAEAAEARRLGGLRRKKEGTVAVAYDLPGLDSVAGIRRLLEIVVTDGVGLENGVARLRVLLVLRDRKSVGSTASRASKARPRISGSRSSVSRLINGMPASPSNALAAPGTQPRTSRSRSRANSSSTS